MAEKKRKQAKGKKDTDTETPEHEKGAKPVYKNGGKFRTGKLSQK